MKTRRWRVYVSGPFSNNETIADAAVRRLNVTLACQLGRTLIDAGYAPMVPHLNALAAAYNGVAWGTWIDVDLAWVEVADVVYRLPGTSRGAEREVKEAKAADIPVVESMTELTAWRDHAEGKGWLKPMMVTSRRRGITSSAAGRRSALRLHDAMGGKP